MSNSAFIIDGDKHIQLCNDQILKIIFRHDGTALVYWCREYYYDSIEYKMQIITNGNIAFDNVGEQ